MNSLLDLGNICLLTLACHSDCAFYCFPPGPRRITFDLAFSIDVKFLERNFPKFGRDISFNEYKNKVPIIAFSKHNS